MAVEVNTIYVFSRFFKISLNACGARTKGLVPAEMLTPINV